MPMKRPQPLIIPAIMVPILVVLANIGLLAGTGWCTTAGQAKKAVTDAVTIRQQAQEKRDQWEDEKTKLVAEYEQLLQVHAALETENRRLTSERDAQAALNRDLLEQQRQAMEVQQKLLPFLADVYDRLDALVSADPPFLSQERTDRLDRLRILLDDPAVTTASKYRKVMESLFIEAEYGNTIEVYQDKIQLNGDDVLGNIFRLGRVSLFFLTLDQSAAAYFNVADRSWQPLAPEHLAAVRSAVEIAGKRKSVELLPLPLGRLAKEENLK